MGAAAVVVDLDGTIWDSEPWFASILATAAGIDPELAIWRLSHTPVATLIRRTRGMSPATFSRQAEKAINDLPLYPGVQETLSALSSAGVALGVGTSLPGWIAKPMLAHTGLAPFFRAVVHSSNTTARKPSAAFLDSVLRVLGEHRGQEVWYVGDREVDAAAAHSAGVAFAWASYGYGPRPDSPIRKVLHSFPDLLEVL